MWHATLDTTLTVSSSPCSLLLPLSPTEVWTWWPPQHFPRSSSICSASCSDSLSHFGLALSCICCWTRGISLLIEMHLGPSRHGPPLEITHSWKSPTRNCWKLPILYHAWAKHYLYALHVSGVGITNTLSPTRGDESRCFFFLQTDMEKWQTCIWM